MPAWLVGDPGTLKISVIVRRNGEVTYQASTSTAALHRTPQGLVDHLWRSQPFPDGAVLSTGTGIVPELDFTLRAGDVVEISIDGVGVLSDPVLGSQADLGWLVEAIDHPLVRGAHRVDGGNENS